MLIRIESTFHDWFANMHGCKLGLNVKRHRPWMDDDGCQCGWPTNKSHTKWIAPEGYQVIERGIDPNGNLVFTIEEAE